MSGWNKNFFFLLANRGFIDSFKSSNYFGTILKEILYILPPPLINIFFFIIKNLIITYSSCIIEETKSYLSSVFWVVLGSDH